MMKKKILILLMLLASGISPIISRPIMIRARSTFQHRRMRAPSATRVSADYETGKLTLNVSAYTGNVQVYVSDSQGNVVGYTMNSVVNGGSVYLDLGTLDEGGYTLDVVLRNATYVGQFDA